MLDTTKDKHLKELAPPPKWHLVTNHLNLLHMLQAGLVTEPAGFRGKHYVDSLAAMPGWIPLFCDKIPAAALKQALSERDYLRPCILSFDLSGVSGPIHILSQQGHIRGSAWPSADIEKTDSGIFIPAPLPITLLSHIYFQSNDDRQAFEQMTDTVSNVDLVLYQLEVKNALFSHTTNDVWPPIIAIEAITPPLKSPHLSPQAVGGLLSMLYHSAKRSELGEVVFQWITCPHADTPLFQIQDPILAELPNWLNNGYLSAQVNTSTRLYWGVMGMLMATHEKMHPSQSVGVILEYLDAQLTQLQLVDDEPFKSSLECLLMDIRSLFSLEGGTITELLERNTDTFSRAVLLFCLRDHCLELLEFSHPLLSEPQYLLAGMLCGARDGWIRQPREMRPPDLSAYFMQHMARIAHQQQGSSLSLPESAKFGVSKT